MKPKSVGLYLFFILVVYSVLLFYLVGLCGGLIGAIINYLKRDVWVFNGEGFFVSLRFSLVYGVGAAIGVWVFSKIEEIKRKRKG